MKKFASLLVMLLVTAVSAKAMSYEQARQQALFLTDKMAYELNLTDAQYEAAYEINLDYLMGVTSYNDLYGSYWEQRNLDLSYILLDWQYRSYVAASYFYRPLYWDAGYWHFGIYARYPHRDYFFFYDRPRVFMEYRGGHSWRMNGGRSWYHGRDFGHKPSGKFSGLRDGFNRGDFGQGKRVSFGSRKPSTTSGSGFVGGSRQQQSNRSNSSFGSRQSSTRTTVGRSSNSSSSSFGTRPSSTFTPKSESSSSSNRSSSFGSGRNSSRTQRSTTTSPSRVSSPTTSSSRSSGSSFGSNRGSFGSSRSSSSSVGGGSRSGSGSRSSAGGGFGSRR